MAKNMRLYRAGPLSYVGSLMGSDMSLLAKAFSTLLAGIGPLSRVGSLMGSEMRTLAKAFPTLLAGIGPLSRVDSLMVSEMLLLAKPFPTLSAGIGPLSCVGSLMDSEILAQAKAFPTLSAGIGPLSCVGSLMDSEILALAKAFPTLSAGIGLLSRVGSLMDSEILSLAKAFPTLSTGIWTLSRVGVLMFDKLLLLSEAFTALPALTGLPCYLASNRATSIPTCFATMGILFCMDSPRGCMVALSPDVSPDLCTRLWFLPQGDTSLGYFPASLPLAALLIHGAWIRVPSCGRSPWFKWLLRPLLPLPGGFSLLGSLNSSLPQSPRRGCCVLLQCLRTFPLGLLLRPAPGPTTCRKESEITAWEWRLGRFPAGAGTEAVPAPPPRGEGHMSLLGSPHKTPLRGERKGVEGAEKGVRAARGTETSSNQLCQPPLMDSTSNINV
uniref:Uncharacterized protein n=1 Tax=Sphenodon punctatus TaxID=8508 RepID=A0A8D0LC17_SPHPU